MVGSQEINLKLKVNWLILILLIAAGLIGAYYSYPAQRQSLIFVASVLAGAAALIAAVNALDSRYAQLKQARSTSALDFINRWNDPQFFHAKKNGREICKALKEQKTVEDQKAYLEEDPAHQANLFDVVNVFECLSIAIQSQIADEDTAKRFFRSIVIEYWHASEEYTKKRRAERGNPRLLQEFEWLFSRWKV